MISYPSIESDNDEQTVPDSFGFTHPEGSGSTTSTPIGDGYTVVDNPTPVMSLTSNDSLFQSNEGNKPNLCDYVINIVLFLDDDNSSAIVVTSQDEEVGGDCNTDDDEDFVVVIPDCFKLEVPLDGFTPPVTEPLSPVKENPIPTVNEQTTPTPDVTTETTPISNDKATTPTPDEDDQQTQPQTPPSSNSPGSVHKPFALFGRDTLGAAWTSRTTNPLRYAVGVVNTVTDLVDQHVHFVSQQSNESKESETTSTDEPKATPTTNPPVFNLPTPPELCNLTCQETDMTRFLNNKWEPNTDKTPLDELVSMGFANRDLNRRLLEKHNNNLEHVIQELLDSNGEGLL